MMNKYIRKISTKLRELQSAWNFMRKIHLRKWFVYIFHYSFMVAGGILAAETHIHTTKRVLIF